MTRCTMYMSSTCSKIKYILSTKKLQVYLVIVQNDVYCFLYLYHKHQRPKKYIENMYLKIPYNAYTNRLVASTNVDYRIMYFFYEKVDREYGSVYPVGNYIAFANLFGWYICRQGILSPNLFQWSQIKNLFP